MDNTEDFEDEVVQMSSILARKLVISKREDTDGES